jgi:DNA-directed RNA polymerase specialized sigma24 family protein
MKPLSERVAAFLAGDEGERVVNRYLRAQDLRNELFDDVVQGALLRAFRRERTQPEFEPDNLEAWTSRLVSFEVRDLLRGRRRRRKREVLVHESSTEDETSFWDRQPDGAPQLEDEVEFAAVDLPRSDESVAGVRRRLVQGLSSRPYPVAAAMCMVNIACDGAEPAEDCPRPRGGVSQDQVPWWAAVFYSGKVNCFAIDGAEEDAAMRARRSRALRETKAILEEATNG